MSKIAYCPNCKSDVKYKIYPKAAIQKQNGLTVVFRKDACKCQQCMSTIFVENIHDNNIQRYKQAYEIANKRRNKIND